MVFTIYNIKYVKNKKINLIFIFDYNLFINKRVINKRTNLGKIYLLNKKIKIVNIAKVKNA